MSDVTDDPATADLVALSRALGDPAADLVILGEGNTSADLGDGTFRVKASGTSLATVGTDDFVRGDRRGVVDLVADESLHEHDQAGLKARMDDLVLDAAAGARPSIETMLHALSLDLAGVSVVAHTHPTAVNALLCSDRAHELVAGALFPDHPVVCGPHPPLVPYAEPGLPLARAYRDGLRHHLDEHGDAPRLVYLGNHGIVALGASITQVRQVTAMAVKAARILQAALAIGRPAFLDEQTVRRLVGRDDERHRLSVLARGGPA